MANVVRNPYSNTAGNTPSSLGNGVLAVNQSDGRIFYRSAAGVVTQFSSIVSYATTASFPASGASTSVLHLATDSSRLYQWTGTVYVEIGVASGYTLPNATSSTLGGVVVGAGLSVSSGTVSANVVSVAGRTGTVTISSSDVSGLGSLATANSVAYSSLTGTPSSFAPSSHASSHASGGGDAITPSSIGAAASSHTHSSSAITDFATEAAKYGPVVSVAGRTGTVTISSGDVSGLPTAGTGSTNYCAGNDSRLSDARSPTSHQHAASDINSGTIATSRLASGTADATTYLRGDQTWAVFAIADGSIASAKLADPFVYDCGAYAAIVPAAPTGISGTPGVGSVALSWTAPTNTGGASLTDYIVQYSTDQSSWTTFADGTSTATTATVTGLTGGTNYYFRVAAVNSVGTGAYVTSTAIAPSASKITISRTNGTSTFTGAGTAGSPYVRATEVLATNADGLQNYRFTASASCTVSFTITGIDYSLNGEILSVRKNGTQVSTLDYSGYDGAGIARSGTAALASGDVLLFQQSYTSSAFKNVSVSAA